MLSMVSAEYIPREVVLGFFPNLFAYFPTSSANSSFTHLHVSGKVLTNLSEMPLTFVAAKDLSLKVIRMGTIGIRSSLISKLVHIHTAEDNYRKI